MSPGTNFSTAQLFGFNGLNRGKCQTKASSFFLLLVFVYLKGAQPAEPLGADRTCLEDCLSWSPRASYTNLDVIQDGDPSYSSRSGKLPGWDQRTSTPPRSLGVEKGSDLSHGTPKRGLTFSQGTLQGNDSD